MKGSAFWKRNSRWLWLAGAAALIGCAGLTIHDMQTAEGTGLYLAMKAGTENRRMYDLLVDGVGILCVLAALLLPCLIFGHLQAKAFFRFTAAYFAFLPLLSTAMLVHLADGTEAIGLREAVLEGRLGEALREGLAGAVPVMAVGVPLLLLAFAAGKAERGGKGKGLCGGWRVVLAVQILLLVAAVLFPALTEPFVYLARYLLLVYGFVLWEELCGAYPELDAWGLVLFAVFWLRGLDRMLETMSVYHV